MGNAVISVCRRFARVARPRGAVPLCLLAALGSCSPAGSGGGEVGPAPVPVPAADAGTLSEAGTVDATDVATPSDTEAPAPGTDADTPAADARQRPVDVRPVDAEPVDATEVDAADGEEAPDAVPCVWPSCPIAIDAFPYHHELDTSASPVSGFDAYGCAPETDESGPEVLYTAIVTTPGTLIATVTDGAGVDVDVHLLGSPVAADCLARGDVGLSVNVVPGTYTLVVDTWVGAGGPLPGAYALDVHFVAAGSPCAMKDEWIARIGTDDLLHMPATGKVVKEAHLVTSEEAAAAVFPSGWPVSFTDHIEEHWALSEQVSGFPLDRSEPWAPCCEPSNEYGQGSSKKPPMEAETWYVNMRWKKAPAPGTRYLVYDGRTGLAVVAAAGYENGPGDLSRIGGAAEEIHLWLGTKHLSTLTFAELIDQDQPFGPTACD